MLYLKVVLHDVQINMFCFGKKTMLWNTIADKFYCYLWVMFSFWIISRIWFLLNKALNRFIPNWIIMYQDYRFWKDNCAVPCLIDYVKMNYFLATFTCYNWVIFSIMKMLRNYRFKKIKSLIAQNTEFVCI